MTGWEIVAEKEEVSDRRGRDRTETKYSAKAKWSVEVPKEIDTIELKAGNRIYASGLDGGMLPGSLIWRAEAASATSAAFAPDARLI